MPLKIILEAAFEKFDFYKTSIKSNASIENLGELHDDAVIILLAALQIAQHGDEGDDPDPDGSGWVVLPIKLLLDAANERCSELELALMELEKAA